MNIPDEYKTQAFWSQMRCWALKMLNCGYHFRGERRWFDKASFNSDCDALAEDLVQQTLLKVHSIPEPDEPILNWGAFLWSQLELEVQTVQRRIERHPPPAHLEGPGKRKLDGSAGLCPIDILESPHREASDERWREWRKRLRTAQDGLLKSAEERLSTWAEEKVIRNKRQIKAFLEIVRCFLDDPSKGFDTHRQEVAAINSATPSKATAARWWDDLRQHLPIEAYKKLAAGEIE